MFSEIMSVYYVKWITIYMLTGDRYWNAHRSDERGFWKCVVPSVTMQRPWRIGGSEMDGCFELDKVNIRNDFWSKHALQPFRIVATDIKLIWTNRERVITAGFCVWDRIYYKLILRYKSVKSIVQIVINLCYQVSV